MYMCQIKCMPEISMKSIFRHTTSYNAATSQLDHTHSHIKFKKLTCTHQETPPKN
jgi:hypothetical protein